MTVGHQRNTGRDAASADKQTDECQKNRHEVDHRSKNMEEMAFSMKRHVICIRSSSDIHRKMHRASQRNRGRLSRSGKRRPCTHMHDDIRLLDVDVLQFVPRGGEVQYHLILSEK